VAASARNPEAQAPQAASPGHTRVDARLLEAALLNLRKRIAAIPLVFQISGSAEVKTERGKLLSQIDDYLLPRVRRSAAPVLVALVGSTGAGKSTLVNSIVGAHVSATGVRRPTTNSPVLACHPDEIDWFAENNFLPTLPRVRQEGLVRPGRDGLLVLAASEGMPRGIALLDTPDIKKSFDAMTKWDVIEAVSIRHLGGMAELSQRAKMAEAGRRLLEFIASNDFKTSLNPDIFRSEAKPLAAHAEAWIAAYRLTEEGQRFPGVTRNLQWAVGLGGRTNVRAGNARISA